MPKKAQTSIEYMIILGTILIIAIPLFYYGLSETTNRIRINQADDAVNTLAKAVDTVHALGSGTKKYVQITIPKGVESTSISEKELSIQIQIFGGKSDISASTKAVLVGNLPTKEGNYLISVEALDSGAVRIGSYNDTDYPIITYTSPSGTINYQNVILKANTNENANCKYNNTDQAYDSMPDSFLGSGQTHESYLFLATGTYTFYVRCRDSVGNTMPSSDQITFTITSAGGGAGGGGNDTLEYNAPIVTIFSPANNSVENQNRISFVYNVTDSSSISACNLVVNYAAVQTDSIVIRNQPENFTRNLEIGNYTWSVSCTDVWNNTGSSQTWKLRVNTTLDENLPIVHLQEPPNNTIRNFWLISFEYNVTDITSNISYCMLHVKPKQLDSTYSYKDDSPTKGQTQSIIFPLPGGNYTWSINCTDASSLSNVGSSEKWDLRINTTEGAGAYITSCAGFCGFEGLRDGSCNPNQNWCGDNCNLPYSSSHDCYAGDNASQVYCEATGFGDACCCST
ncbi:hypothetical protein HY643_03610 [Candidatus Woesearchaeota archaeon]|nr:hypothetical protein [Candidatus Woesearchaeota archaeon]